MFTFAKQPQSVFALVKDGLVFYKQAFLKILPIIIVTVLLSSGMNSVLQLGDVKAQHWLFMLLFLCSVLIGSYFLCIILQKMYDLGRQVDENLFHILHQSVVPGCKLFLAMLIFTIVFVVLAMVLLLVSAVCVALPVGFVGWFFSLPVQPLVHKGMLIFGVFYGVVFVLFTVYFYSLMVFYAPLIVFDRVGPVKVLKKSILLLRHNWWRVFAVLLSTLIIVAVILITGLLILQHIKAPNYLFIAFTGLATIVFGPWFYSVLLVLYNDLKLKQEA